MGRNLIKIMSHAIVRSGLTVLTGLADDVIVYLKLVLMSPVIKITESQFSMAFHHFHLDLNAPCLPPSPQILHNHLFPFFIGYCSRIVVYVKMVNWRMYKKKLYKKKKTTMVKPITFKKRKVNFCLREYLI